VVIAAIIDENTSLSQRAYATATKPHKMPRVVTMFGEIDRGNNPATKTSKPTNAGRKRGSFDIFPRI